MIGTGSFSNVRRGKQWATRSTLVAHLLFCCSTRPAAGSADILSAGAQALTSEVGRVEADRMSALPALGFFAGHLLFFLFVFCSARALPSHQPNGEE